MKSYKIYFLAIVLLLASCSSNDEITDNADNFPADKVVRIATKVNNSLQTTKSLRSLVDYTGTDIGLSIDCTADDAYDYDNQKWSTADNGITWTTLSQMLWKNATATNNIFAYAPYDEEFNSTSYTFSAQQDQSLSTLSSDFVTYKSDGYVAGESLDDGQAIAVTFNHKMAKLKIVFTNGNQYTEDQLADYTLTVNAKTSADYIKSTDVATVSPDSTSQDIIGCNSSDAGIYEAQVVIAPQIIESGKKFIKFVMNDPEKTFYFTASEDYGFSSGYAYKLNVKIGKDKLTLDNEIEVGSWNDPVEMSAGEAVLTYIDIHATENEILLNAPGKLTSEAIASAINKTSGYLKISGSMNDDDIFTLRDWAYDNEENAICLKDLDMSAVTGLTALPDCAFSPLTTEWNGFMNESSCRGISSLITLTLPESIVTIGSNAFRLCGSLASVNLNSVTNIKEYAFEECTNLVLDENSLSNVEVIEMNGFKDCSSLSIINAPKLEALTQDVFSNCGILSKINISGALNTDKASKCLASNNVSGDIWLPNLKSLNSINIFWCTSAATVHLTAAGEFALNSLAFNTTYFNDITKGVATTLYLNIDKKDGSTYPQVSGTDHNTWGGITWNNIYYLKADGSYVDYDGIAVE